MIAPPRTAWTTLPSRAGLVGAALLAAAVWAAPAPARAETPPPPNALADDADRQRAEKLFGAIREILDEAARERLAQRKEPDGAVENFVRRQFGMDQDRRVRDLLGSAFGVITQTPVVDMQDEIAAARAAIAKMRGQIAELKEKRIAAPDDAGVSGWVGLAEDRASITNDIEALEKSIVGQEEKIADIKRRFGEAMAAAGAPLPPEQVDLLLESVTAKDLVSLAAAYQAVRGVSEQLRKLMDESGEDVAIAKRYYGMHTALIALLVEAQNRFLRRMDGEYLPKLAQIERDIQATAAETRRLLKDEPTRAQRKALLANAKSQALALEALKAYRDVLMRQRAQVTDARDRTAKELRVADNTLRTVEASFQLKKLMESAAASFEALRSLESPGLERVFRNEDLKREFKNLTDKLAPGS